MQHYGSLVLHRRTHAFAERYLFTLCSKEAIEVIQRIVICDILFGNYRVENASALVGFSLTASVEGQAAILLTLQPHGPHSLRPTRTRHHLENCLYVQSSTLIRITSAQIATIAAITLRRFSTFSRTSRFRLHPRLSLHNPSRTMATLGAHEQKHKVTIVGSGNW